MGVPGIRDHTSLTVHLDSAPSNFTRLCLLLYWWRWSCPQDGELAEFTGEALRPHRLSWFERWFVHGTGSKPLSRSGSAANMYGATEAAGSDVTTSLHSTESPTHV